jgi:hypothetical protein
MAVLSPGSCPLGCAATEIVRRHSQREQRIARRTFSSSPTDRSSPVFDEASNSERRRLLASLIRLQPFCRLSLKERRRLYLRFFRRRTLEEVNREFFVIVIVLASPNLTIVSY